MKPALFCAALIMAPVLALPDAPALAQQAQIGAQTWGQPGYGAYARPSPLSEARHNAHARLGAAGDGYTYGDGPVPAYRGHRHDGRHFGRGGWRADGPRVGYRDEWGYNDDRPPRFRTGRRATDWPRDSGPDDYPYDR